MSKIMGPIHTLMLPLQQINTLDKQNVILTRSTGILKYSNLCNDYCEILQILICNTPCKLEQFQFIIQKLEAYIIFLKSRILEISAFLSCDFFEANSGKVR